MKTIYIAGPMLGYTWEQACMWRRPLQQALEAVGFTSIHPGDTGDWKPGETLWFKDEGKLNTHGIDALLVSGADMLLANLSYADRPSVGSIMEIAWAWTLGKPVIIVRGEAEWTRHPFITGSALAWLDSLDEVPETLEMLRGRL